jgi:hypothetical protein
MPPALRTIDPATGAVTAVIGFGDGGVGMGIDFDENGT